MIEPLLFINFVENSFKHGINTVSDSAWMRILIEHRPESKLLFFEIENSKPFEKKENDEKSETSGGIGLSNAKKRLKLLYPNKHNLVITDTGKTYLVKLMLILN
jgi:LytS/YehU family sensor histidine kinase